MREAFEHGRTAYLTATGLGVLFAGAAVYLVVRGSGGSRLPDGLGLDPWPLLTGALPSFLHAGSFTLLTAAALGAGPVFQRRWADRTLGELYTYVHDVMPLGVGGSLDDEVYVAIVSFILDRNGFEAGESEFDPDDEVQAALPLVFGD